MSIAAIISSQDREVITVAADARLVDVIALLAQKRIGAVPVMRDDQVVGIISERDVLYQLAGQGAAILDMAAAAVMTAPAITVTGDVPVMAALGLMTRRRIRHLPVVENDRLLGFVSIGDLVKMRIDRIEAEATSMRDYIQGS